MQQQSENTVIERLKEIVRTSRHATGEPTWRPQRSGSLVTQEELAQAETQLGFVLPPLLRRMYLEVGNGGFGPGYGLLPLYEIPHAAYSLGSLVAEYQEMRSFSQKDIDTHFAEEEEKPALWPERVLIICDWGCSIYSCLDCSSPALPIFRMDGNVNFMIEWAIEASSLQQWLEAWLDGKPLSHLDWEHAAKVAVSHLWEAHLTAHSIRSVDQRSC